jgi:hypothetical protein
MRGALPTVVAGRFQAPAIFCVNCDNGFLIHLNDSSSLSVLWVAKIVN